MTTATKPFNPYTVPDYETKSIYELIGKGYENFWWFPGRYVVVKGSRASKKSYSVAYWLILNMMKHPQANAVVVRKIADNNRDSTYAMLCKIIYMLGVEDKWVMNKSPLKLEYQPRGPRGPSQEILFRGLDDPQKLASLQVTHGVLCWMWVEEAYQIDKEEDFDRIDQSIRGIMPEGLHPRIMLTFNPWHREHWLRYKFFEAERDDTLAMTTDYRCNEFISEFDKQYFEDLKVRNPRLYKVAGLGDWGISEGLIYTDWEEKEFDVNEIMKRESAMALFGLDFGFATDPCALICSVIDTKTRTIYVYDEWYAKGQTNMDIAERIKEMGYAKERIVCDSAEPKSIYELQKFGLLSATGAIKGRDSVEYGIQKLQQYHIEILPRCVNFLLEIGMYSYDQDSKGKMTNKPIHDFSHGPDALRYSILELLYRSGKYSGLVVGPSEDRASLSYEDDQRELDRATQNRYVVRIKHFIYFNNITTIRCGSVHSSR